MKQMYVPIVLMTCALLSELTVSAQCTAVATNVAAASGENAAVGSVPWTNTGKTKVADGQCATADALLSIHLFPFTVATHYLTLNSFGFAIPTANTICGVELNVIRGYTSLASINAAMDNVVQLATISGGTVTLLGTNQASGNAWSYGSLSAQGYGGSGQLMGTTTLTPTVVNNTNFGVAISMNLNSGALGLGLAVEADIDAVSMTIYTTPAGTLPITLENFAVVGGSAGNQISWKAGANDVANQFVVQRSSDGSHWSDLTTITAATGDDRYSYTDGNPLAGVGYYRLKLLDDDGTIGYSVVAAVSGKAATPTIHFYPNPFHDMITITAPGSFTHLALKDIAGRMLWVKEYPGGVNSAQVPAGDLPTGIYFVTVDGVTYKVLKN